ncbi:hypothetical protein MBLNU457_5982t1 [Dothideomycetes sp. NU457]
MAVNAVDRLQKLLNDVFVMTGEMFKDANSPNANVATAQAHGTRLKRYLPSTAKSFQDALDELETQIAVAQAVMRRDLVQLRSQQKTNGTTSENPGQTTAPDVDMTFDEPTQDTAQPSATNGNHATAAVEPSNTTAKTGDTESGTTNHKTTAQPDPDQDKKPSKDGIVNEDARSTTADNPIDFDSLFNDDMDIGGAAEETKPESPTKQDNGTTQQPQPSSTANDGTNHVSDFSFEVFNEQNPTDDSDKQDDLSTLLPGLESYANEGQDFSMPDFTSQANGNGSSRTISATDSQQPQAQQQQQGQSQNQGQGQSENPQGDMVFGDLMDFGNDFNNNFGFGGDTNLDDNRFDDDFFNVE